jgi:hypothetical protein
MGILKKKKIVYGETAMTKKKKNWMRKEPGEKSGEIMYI